YTTLFRSKGHVHRLHEKFVVSHDGLKGVPSSGNDTLRPSTAASQPLIHGGETMSLLVPGILILDKPPPVLSQPSALLIGPFEEAKEALGDFACLGIDHNGSLGVGQLGKVAGRRNEAR